jgi:hypothetical protein
MHLISRFRDTVALTALACLVSAPHAQAQATVYNQPTDLNGGFPSQNDSNKFGNYSTVYDDFTLSSTTSIGTVTWAGDYFNGSPSNITAFTLQFYGDNAGQPGSLLQTTTISGNANETAAGNDNVPLPFYTYSAALSTPFSATGGTHYWMSIVADLIYPPQWEWETATGGNGTAYQVFNTVGNPISNDFTFSLVSTAAVTTPEPGSVALLAGMGLTAAVCVRRRKRSRKTA